MTRRQKGVDRSARAVGGRLKRPVVILQGPAGCGRRSAALYMACDLDAAEARIEEIPDDTRLLERLTSDSIEPGVTYFADSLRRYAASPFLVTLERTADGFTPGRLLRASALALMEVVTANDDGPVPGAPEAAALATLEQLGQRSRHPMVQVRHWRAQAAAATRQGEAARALEAARRQAAVAQRAELLEWRCEALHLIGQLDAGPAADAARRQSMELALAQGYVWLTSPARPPPCRRR